MDDGEWHEREELLRADTACRKELGWNTDIAHVAQPWSLPKEEVTHTVRLRWHIQSEIEYEGAKLAIERIDMVSLLWNGEKVDNVPNGWFTDKSIKTVALPKIRKGDNLLEAVVPISKRITVEWAYILGDFGVEVYGKNARIISKPKELAFGDITRQGLPFYSGNIVYHIPIATKEGILSVRSNQYIGAMQEVNVDGNAYVPNLYPPYIAELGEVKEGTHLVNMKLYGTRINSFGALHLADAEETNFSPSAYRTKDDRWCYEYKIREMGVLTTPEIIIKGGH